MRIGLSFDLNINKDHLHINDYLPSIKSEAFGAKGSRVRCGSLTEQHAQSNMPLLLRKGAIQS